MHLFHSWGKWEALHVINVKGGYGGRWEETQLRRICSRCGLVKSRYVKGDVR